MIWINNSKPTGHLQPLIYLQWLDNKVKKLTKHNHHPLS